MKTIEIPLKDVCPHLASTKTMPNVEIDPNTSLDGGVFCEVGEKNVYAEITTDMALNPKKVDVEISCAGCVYQETFKVIKRKQV